MAWFRLRGGRGFLLLGCGHGGCQSRRDLPALRVSSVMRFAHDSSFCGRSQGGFRLCGGGISCLRARPKDGARLAALRSPFGNLRGVTYKIVSYPTLAGRGGSVSRRDHNQAARNRIQLAGERKSEGRDKLIPQTLFGRGGLGERRFSQRSGLSPRSTHSTTIALSASSAGRVMENWARTSSFT